jgi:hypothetical protein
MSEQNQTYEITEYNGVAAALHQIEVRYAGRVYDVTTKAGMDDAKFARREIRTTRTGLERMRKELKEPALRRCQLIDGEAKGITMRLIAIEDPIDKMITTEEQRVENEKREKERLEVLRVSHIKERIEMLNGMPTWGASAADIMARLRVVSDVPIDESFGEYSDAAAIVKAGSMSRLSIMHADALAVEQEQENLRRVAAETEAKMAAEREANAARLAEERAKAETERQERIAAQKALDDAQANERARLAEEARIARECQQLAEQARQVEAQAAAEAAELAERDLALEKAKAHSSEEALQRVADVVDKWLNEAYDAEAAMDEIEVIVAANA